MTRTIIKTLFYHLIVKNNLKKNRCISTKPDKFHGTKRVLLLFLYRRLTMI